MEHASPEAIREALKDAHKMDSDVEEIITQEDLIDAGLIGGERSKERRTRMGQILKIGYTNGKQLHKRLMMFQISKAAFSKAILQILQEEQDA